MLSVPEAVTFEQAIALTESLLDQIEQGQISDAEVQQTITNLVSSVNGARGFFVTYLSDARSLADNPSQAVIQALQSSPHTVVDLLVKNLAMSTAMEITHQRNQNTDMAASSHQVQTRTSQLIRQTQFADLPKQASQLIESAQTGAGAYQSFLQRWHYDDEQRHAIQQALQSVLS